MKKIVSIALATAALVAFGSCTSKPSAKAQLPSDEAPSWTIPAGEVIVLDNFEEGNFWVAVGDSWDQWGAHNWSIDADLTEEWKSEGDYAAVWEWDPNLGPPSDQATFFCDQLVETDWTGIIAVVIDVNNVGDAPFTMQFNTQTSDAWQWTQTPSTTIPPGVHTVVFDLTAGLQDGSSADIDAIPSIDVMKRAMFTVTSSQGPTKTLVDNIRLVKE